MSKLPWLREDDISFPDLESAMEEPNGLLAAGGDLSVERLTEAYRNGIFPWYDEQQPILWWSPDPRMVIVPGQLTISRSLKKLIRKSRFEISMDRCFHEVIANCATVRKENQGTWITREMQQAYISLHHHNIAHSVEVWCDSRLAGGLYGIAIGQVFFGESMFSLEDNASKIALVYLSKQLQLWGFGLIDCQIASQHLENFGAREIPRRQFHQRLVNYRDKQGKSGPWKMGLGAKEVLGDAH